MKTRKWSIAAAVVCLVALAATVVSAWSVRDLEVGGTSVNYRGLVVNLDGLVTQRPANRTGDGFTVNARLLTTGNALKILAVDTTLNGGKYINLYGAAAATSVWSVGEDGVTLVGAGSGHPLTTAGGTTQLFAYAYHDTNALTGELIAVRGSARVDTIDSASGTVIGGRFQAGNMGTGTDLATATGVYVDVANKTPSGATTWTNARGYEVSMDLDQGSAGNVNTITNAYMFYGVYNLPTAGTYATVTNGYGIFVRNEAVGGTGQMLDAAFYADDLNQSGGVKGWAYGLDFGGITSGGFGTADIRLASDITISSGSGSPDGTITAPQGSLYIDTAGAADAQLWINEAGTTAWCKVDTTT